MSRFYLAPVLAVAISFSARAETPAALAPSASVPPENSTPPPNDSSRATSPETTARVAAALPKFMVRPATPAENSARPPVDLRDTDRPRNTIIRLPSSLLPQASSSIQSATLTETDAPSGVVRLPKFSVRDRRYPALKNRDVLTPEAKSDLEFKRHPGLHIGNLFGLNRGIAAAMAAEDDAHERGLEMADLLSLQHFADAHPSKESDLDDSPAETKPAAMPAPAAVTK